MKGQAVNIDWTVGLSLFLLSSISTVLFISQPGATEGSGAMQNMLVEVSSQLEEETYIRAAKTPIYVESPVNMNTHIPLDRAYVFEDFSESATLNSSSQINPGQNRIVSVVKAKEGFYRLTYAETDVLEGDGKDVQTSGNTLSNDFISLSVSAPGLSSLKVDGKDLLNETAEINSSNYSIYDRGMYAATLDGLKIYGGTSEMIIEDPGTATFHLKKLQEFYWHADGSTTQLDGSGVSKSGETSGFSIASDYGITFVGDLNATVTELENEVKVEVETDRLRLFLHDSGVSTGEERIKFHNRSRISFGFPTRIEGATEKKLKNLSSLTENELERRLGLEGLGYNITYGVKEYGRMSRSVEQEVNSVSDWRRGIFKGTTTRPKGDTGRLKIGYRNGTEKDDIGIFWRFDGESGEIRDYSGNDYNGTITGSFTRSASGVWSTEALKGDGGSGDYVTSTFGATRETDRFSLLYWQKPDSSGDLDSVPLTLYQDGDDSTAHTEYEGSEGRTEITVTDSSGASLDQKTCKDAWKADNWNFEVLTVNGEAGSWTYYVNGTEQCSGSFTAGTDIHRFDTFENRWKDGGYNFDGFQDNPMFINGTLSEQEVENLYRGGADSDFDGNYTAEKVDSAGEKDWESIEVDADIPSETDLSVEVRTSNEFGQPLDDQVIDLETGERNYSLDVESSEQLQAVFRGSSSNVTKSWKVDSFRLYLEGGEKPTLVRAGSRIPFADAFVLNSQSSLIRSNGTIETIQNKAVIWR